MSFILDALRKSEHERQRQTGPGLAEVAIAPRATRTNTWATVAVVLLIVNLVAVGVLLLRKAQQEPAPSKHDAAPALTPRADSDASGPLTPVATAPAGQASITRTLPEAPPMLRPAEALPVSPSTRNPLEQEVSDYAPPIDPQMAAAAAAAPGGPPAVTRVPATGGTVIYQAIPESGGGAPPPAQAPRPTTVTPGLPTADEVVARGGVPELRLELHVYANRPAERFAFINSRKYREGDTLAEGPQVEEITPDGVVLSQHGSRFLLSRE